MKKRLGHIYLVDDNHDMRFYLSDMLSMLGYTVDHYDNAQSFLDKSSNMSPAVVLLGPRQVGKTTLARKIAADWPSGAVYLDMERPADRRRLDDGSSPRVALAAHSSQQASNGFIASK